MIKDINADVDIRINIIIRLYKQLTRYLVPVEDPLFPVNRHRPRLDVAGLYGRAQPIKEFRVDVIRFQTQPHVLLNIDLGRDGRSGLSRHCASRLAGGGGGGSLSC